MSYLKKIILLCSVLVNTACASEPCVFADDFFSEEKYKTNSLISKYVWSEINKEAKGVFSNGNLFSIKHWSCEHYGTHAVLFVGPNLEEIPANINKYVLMLAEVSLTNEEANLLEAAIGKRDLLLSNSPQRIVVRSDEYSEFYVSFSITNDVIFIDIKLYRD